MRVQTEDIVFVQADGNYSDLYLFSGKPHKMTFKLHYFDDCFYRTADGVAHSIGDDTKYEGKHKDESIIPWLVFKKRN